jgi:DNA-binding NtrC family response regulator
VTKILIIDDDSAVRDTILAILESKGYSAVAAADGEHGLDLFRSERPDLVISDIIMPNKDGIETILAMHRERAETKIIAISGGGRLGNVDYLEIVKNFGACEVIAKPFDPDELIGCIGRCLEGAKAP